MIPHYRSSFVVQKGYRKVIENHEQEIHQYTKKYAIDEDDTWAHLIFALKHEGINLTILKMLFFELSQKDLARFITMHPAGKYTRIVWYLYEFLLNKSLPIEDASSQISYCYLLDENFYFTSYPEPRKRYRVYDNLLGGPSFCPIVRKTERIHDFQEKHFNLKIEELVKDYDSSIIQRAVQYLYTKETLSSYEIERERPSKRRASRFAEFLRKSAHDALPFTKETIVEAQNAIIDERFSEKGYRKIQNFIGQLYQLKVHYICPKPQDVEYLMRGLIDSYVKMAASHVHPVVIAAVVSFGFVYIHPFEDGNGRISRYLIHAILSAQKFISQGIIFPVSAVMLENRKQYDEVLESFSRPLLESVEYAFNEQDQLVVEDDTADYYRFIDYTKMVEFLFWCIEKAIDDDFKRELRFVAGFDKAKQHIQSVIDMPDRLLELIIVLISKNNGTLSYAKRKKHFSMLTDSEIEAIERVVRECLCSEP